MNQYSDTVGATETLQDGSTFVNELPAPLPRGSEDISLVDESSNPEVLRAADEVPNVSEQADPISDDLIREQYDFLPYPRVPLDRSFRDDIQVLFYHNFSTPYYRKHKQLFKSSSLEILDIGCGSGCTTLRLAEANPGASILALDISPKSVEVAKQRLEIQGFSNIEFKCMSLDDLPQLGRKFDFINCDEVLSIYPDPCHALSVMKQVLSPVGFIRTNIHNTYQRNIYHRAQEFFTLMGLTEENPTEFEVNVVADTLRQLKKGVEMKRTWGYEGVEPERLQEAIRMNHLLLGDKGCTIPEVFAMLRETNLEFVSMLEWVRWDIYSLFQNEDDMPAAIGLRLMEASIEDRLHSFELLQPTHRLIDFWCGHPSDDPEPLDCSEWSDDDWLSSTVTLHPQLQHPKVKQLLLEQLEKRRPFEISYHLPRMTLEAVQLESLQAALLLPLWEAPMPFKALLERWQRLNPVDPLSMEPFSPDKAFAEVCRLLLGLELSLYVMLERAV